MCPSANIRILLYFIKRFLEVFLSLAFSFLSKKKKFLCGHTQVLVWKPETLRCPLMSLQLAICFPLISPFAQQEDWVVSCWNSRSSSSISSSHMKPPLAAVCTVSKESWRTRQVGYVKNFGLNASSQKQLPEVSDWCHMMNCSLLAALVMEGAWILGWSAPNLFARAGHPPALYCKGKAKLSTGQCEFSPFSSESFKKTVCVPSSL